MKTTIPKLWLPKVWFQGSQSTSTSGSSVMTGIDCVICCWLVHHMRCVLMTALGKVVEPLVNGNLTMVSGPVACRAASTAPVAGVAYSASKPAAVACGQVALGKDDFQFGVDAGLNGLAVTRHPAANTRPGVTVSSTWRSLA